MPTGYTAAVEDGTVTDFRTFALRCARAMGACVMQRDDPMDAPPKLRVESKYYAEAVERDEARVAELSAMTPAEADNAARAEYDRQLTRNAEYDIREAAIRGRYNAMLTAVMEWEPPTPEHEGLKDFMRQQLVESRKFDCGPPWPEPVRQTGAAWLAEQKQKAHESLARSIKGLADERERVAGANAWIGALYDSLRETVPA